MPKLNMSKKIADKGKMLSGLNQNNESSDFATETNYMTNIHNTGSGKRPQSRRYLKTETVDKKKASDVCDFGDVGNQDDMSNFIGQFQSVIKNKKKQIDNFATDCVKESQNKLTALMEKQAEIRRQGNERLIRSLSSMLTQLEADGVTLKENEQRLLHITSAQMKSVQQASAVHAQRLQALKEIHSSYVKQCDMVEATHREQCDVLLDEMATDAHNMQQKLVAESRKTGLDTLRKTMIVQGLLKCGGMKAADRPIWLDVYKAFPPAVEPKYSRPKPTHIPIKTIFYEEDKQRAKFHAAGHGLGAVNMLTQSGDTHTKRLLRQYETLQSQGVPEDKLLEESVIGAEKERGEYQVRFSKVQPKETFAPEKNTTQVLDMKELFDDKPQ